MTSSLINAFEALTNNSASPDTQKKALHAIKSQYALDNKLPIDIVLAFTKKITQTSKIAVFSDILDHYAPSHAKIPKEKRDTEWAFFDTLSDADKAADAHFFNSLWAEAEKQGTPITSPLGEILAFSRIKHSGWFSEAGFHHNIAEFEKEYGRLPIESVLDYENEDDLCFPDLFVIRWLMGNCALSGLEETARMLKIACENTEKDTVFDLENFWINHHEKLKTWFQVPFGKMIIESQKLLIHR